MPKKAVSSAEDKIMKAVLPKKVSKKGKPSTKPSGTPVKIGKTTK